MAGITEKKEDEYAAIRFYKDERKKVHIIPVHQIKNFALSKNIYNEPFYVESKDPVSGEIICDAAQILKVGSTDDLKNNTERYIFHKLRLSDALEHLNKKELSETKNSTSSKIAAKEIKKLSDLRDKEVSKRMLEEKVKSVFNNELNFDSSTCNTNDEILKLKQHYEQIIKGYADAREVMKKDKEQLEEVLEIKNKEIEKLKFELDHAKRIIESLEAEKIKPSKSPIRKLFPDEEADLENPLSPPLLDVHHSSLCSPVLGGSLKKRVSKVLTPSISEKENQSKPSTSHALFSNITHSENDTEIQHISNESETHKNKVYNINDNKNNTEVQNVKKRKLEDKNKKVNNSGNYGSDEELESILKNRNLKGKRKKVYDSEDDYNSDHYKKAEHKKNYEVFERVDNGKTIKMIHLRFDLSIPYRSYKMIWNEVRPSLFVRHLAKVLWTERDLMNRALKVQKTNKNRLTDRSPRKPLTPKKKAILQKCYIDYLKQTYTKTLFAKYEKEWRKYLSVFINGLIEKELENKKNNDEESKDE